MTAAHLRMLARCRIAGLAVAILSAAISGAPATEPRRDCAAIDRQARAAEVGLDLAAMAKLVDEARAPGSGCDPAWVAALETDLVNLHVNRFFLETETVGGGVEAMRRNLPILEAGHRRGETWQLLLTLAEVHYELGDYTAAAPLYQEAVARMAEAARMLPPLSAEARMLPGVSDFEMIHGRMLQSALLADAYEPPPVRRGAADAGLFVERWRGFVVRAVPLPIQFEFGTTAFTPKGERAAAHLADYLKASDKTTVTLVGHTDPVGETDANQRLSESRAEAVREYLEEAGYTGTVMVVGKGESEPFRPVDAARFADDLSALYALDRRVELVR